jgi:hypothetical protein
MKHLMLTLLVPVALVLQGLPMQSMADPISLPLYSVAYTASYRFGILTFTADTDTTMSWDDQAGEYLYNTNFEANGIASLKFPGMANDRGRFKLDCRGIVPVENRRDDGSDKRDEDLLTEFDADNNRATVHYQGEIHEFDLPSGTVDPQILSLAVMLDMQQGLALGTYTALDRTKIKTYPFKAIGEERLATKIGTLPTIVLQEGTDTSIRTRKVWVAPELDFLPVKIEYRRKGKTQATMTIDSLVRNGRGPLVECDKPASNASRAAG